jgi:hypothetical protein
MAGDVIVWSFMAILLGPDGCSGSGIYRAGHPDSTLIPMGL